MKALVTGASGFIGYNLVKELLAQGYEVTGLVRQSSLTNALRELDVPLAVADVTDADSVKKAIDAMRPDIVVHAAARVAKTDLETYYTVNALGTDNVCRASNEAGVRRLVHISSVAAIDGNASRPLTDDMPLKSTSPYGDSKLEAEKFIEKWRAKGLRCAVVRPCMIYGREEPHALDRLSRAVRKRRIPLIDSPFLARPLQLGYVANIAQVIRLCMEKEEALEGSFIAADRDRLSYSQIIEMFYSFLTGAKPPRVPGVGAFLINRIGPLRRKMDLFFRERTYDISRAEELLGWGGGISTRDGLWETLAHWRGLVR